MNRERVDKWTRKLGQAWCAKDVDAALALVSKANIAWQESPFSKTVTSWDEIYRIWKADLAKQRNISFSHNVLALDGETGIIRWHAQYTSVADQGVTVLDGIFQITLDESNLCTKFIMWTEQVQKDE